MDATGGLSVADLVERHGSHQQGSTQHGGNQPGGRPAYPPQQPPRSMPAQPPQAQQRRQPPPGHLPPPPHPAQQQHPSNPRLRPVAPPPHHQQPPPRTHRPVDAPPPGWRGPAEPPAGRPRGGHPGMAPQPGPFPGARQAGPGMPMRQGTAIQSGPQVRPLPRIPNQVPGQASMPPAPPPHAASPAWPTESPSMPGIPPVRPQGNPTPARPPSADELDPIGLTTEMEAIGTEAQKRRKVDHTLARFSKVHDELKAEEREKKAKRKRLFPWASEDELDRLDEIVGLQSPELAPEDDPALQPAPAPAPSRAEPRRLRRTALAGKIVAGVVALLVFASTAVAWGFKSWVNSKQVEVEALDQNSAAILDRSAQYGDENFLMVGSDTREGATAEDGVGDAASVGGARADTIMIAHVPANRKRVVVVSFPRDLEVKRPACEGWDAKTGKYNGQQFPAQANVKINSVYATGGPKCVTKMVQELSGLAINHFVGIDFNGFKGMVDAVQGVQVCVEKPLKDTVLGTVVKEPGKAVNLTGDQALNFVRARHVIGDPTSDYGRIIRQQRFLSALLRKAMSNQVLLDPGKLTGFVNAFAGATFGDNVGVDQLMLLGQSMQGIEAGRVSFITVPTVGEANQRGNEVLRTKDNELLFKAIRDDTPLAGETPAPPAEADKTPTNAPAPSQPVDPKTIKLQVLNGGNTTGKIAAKTAGKLQGFGFQVVNVNNAVKDVPKTVVKYGKDKEAAARVVASAIPGAQMQEDASAAGALILVIGPEYKGDVVAPTGTPAPTAPADLPKVTTVNGGDVTCA
ncbi:LCP family protein [Actinophytocola sp.]|uniref:LCP family protein n=1 Tax=Actinophytocola sp. TaxID=1872138 RepID=UPI002D7E70DD|nr:LCP family protein [Actinophytocola sp.]HET9142907.1 LCP family protein [Actinophytocola sp.]